ncbi:hypothetical protein [Peptoclostridium sp. AF21-18]|uniref:hypothetical protein n=1 Tax=Peptoclostridium sp. AF21-18 TaxID=2292243 RepID=UPI000E4C8112|nr:hypothetical protein [Peptoclostridium sp. AF21-18]RHQ98851.1 hypothetical protein DWX74_03290 [Peptoclostridium sp. AF21-18]
MNIKKNKTLYSLLLSGVLIFSSSAPILASVNAEEVTSEIPLLEEVSTTDNANSDVTVINNVDELENYIADYVYEHKAEITPYYVGWKDDLVSGQNYWNKSKQGKCVANVINPITIVKNVILNLSPKDVKKLSTTALAKLLMKKGLSEMLSYSVAYDIAACIKKYPFS